MTFTLKPLKNVFWALALGWALLGAVAVAWMQGWFQYFWVSKPLVIARVAWPPLALASGLLATLMAVGKILQGLLQLSGRGSLAAVGGSLIALMALTAFGSFWLHGFSAGDGGKALAVFLLMGLPAYMGLGGVGLRGLGLGSLPLIPRTLAAFGLGLGLFGTVALTCGALGWMFLAIALPFFLGWTCLVLTLWRSGKSIRAEWQDFLRQPLSTGEWLAGLAVMGLCLVNLLYCLRPTLDCDALGTFLSVPQEWIRAGRVVSGPFMSNAHLPPLPFALNLTSLLLGVEQVCHLNEWAAYAGFLALCGYWAGKQGGPFAGWAAALLAAGLPGALSWVPTGQVNFLNGYLVALGLLMIEEGGGFAAGLFMGLASTVKPFSGIYFACLLPSWALFRRREASFWGAAWLILGFVLGSMPWWAKNVLEEGTLLYPPFWRVPAVIAYQVGKPESYSLGCAFQFLWRAGTDFLGYGPALLLLAPLGLAAIKLGMRLGWLHFWAWLAFAASFFMTTNPRWYLCLLPYALLLSAWGLAAAWQSGKRIAWVALPALLLQVPQLLSSAFSPPGLKEAGIYELGLQSRSQYLERFAPGWPGFEAANRLVPPRGRVLLYCDRRAFLLRVPMAFGDPVFGCEGFSYRGIKREDQLEALCRKAGITHVLWNHNEAVFPSLLDSPPRRLLDPLWKQLLSQRGELLFRGSGMELYALHWGRGGSISLRRHGKRF